MKEPKPRFVTPEARSFLEEKLGLVSDPYMQDWEVELADENRIDEFKGFYEANELSDDVKFALMALIIASCDDAICEGLGVEDKLKRIENLITVDAVIHEYTLHYWHCDWTTDQDGQFFVTPWIRKVSQQVASGQRR